MPFELVGFVSRVSVEAAYHVILAVGAGEDRKAAIVRSIIFAALVMLLAKLLHWLLIADQSVSALDLFVALPTIYWRLSGRAMCTRYRAPAALGRT